MKRLGMLFMQKYKNSDIGILIHLYLTRNRNLYGLLTAFD